MGLTGIDGRQFKGHLLAQEFGRRLGERLVPLMQRVEGARKQGRYLISFVAGAAVTLDGKVLDQAAIRSLSALPSREALIGQALSVMIGVPTGLARALNDVPRRLMNVLQAISDQKEAA